MAIEQADSEFILKQRDRTRHDRDLYVQPVGSLPKTRIIGGCDEQAKSLQFRGTLKRSRQGEPLFAL
jgi:hypothetical protein